MASFDVVLKPSFHKDLKRISKDIIPRIWARIRDLETNPVPKNSAKLSGFENLYRLRVGNYRVIYQYLASDTEIIVFRVRHRREVYRGL
jgi:mRNA interferase RelE/StbE